MLERSHARWRSARFRDANDLTLAHVPSWATDLAQDLLRRGVLSRIGRHASEFHHVLDLACGTGEWTAGYLSIARRGTGVDINEDFLRVARQRAFAFGLADRLVFVSGTIEEAPIASDVDFVSLGGCLMYLGDVQVNRVLSRIAAQLPARGMAYVRSSVVTPLRRRWGNDIAVYRDVDEYETLFRANGLRVVDRAYSARVVADFVASELVDAKLRPALRSSLAALARFMRASRHSTDFCNWVLAPA